MSDPSLLEYHRLPLHRRTIDEASDLAPAALVLFTLAALALAVAIHVRDGEYSLDTWRVWRGSIFWLAVALPLCAAGVAWRRTTDLARGHGVILAALAVAVSAQFALLLRSPPSGWNPWSDDLVRREPANLRLYYGGVAAASLFTAASLAAKGRLRHACVALVLLTHLLLGAWTVRSCPSPHIDVFHFQQEGARALLAGRNPYAVRMPDVYAGTARAADRSVYGQGLSNAGRLEFGFPYTPLSLLLSTAGFVATGDHRYAQALALTLAGGLLAYARGGRVGLLAAVLLLFTPRAFFILGRGWTEPFVALGLAGVAFVACRKPGGVLLPVVVGLFLATKQYLVFAAPALLLIAPRLTGVRSFAKFVATAAGVAVLVTAPLALWDARAFVHSTATVQQVAPFRTDALSFLVWHHFRTGQTPGVLAAFVAMAVGVAVALWRLPRTPAGCAAALAATFLPFIAFNKQAFANYYLLPLAAACAAVAARDWARRPR